MEFYVKPVCTFENDSMRMADMTTFNSLKNKLYNVDTEHNKTKYSDGNMLIITNAEPESELTPDIVILRNKVIAKMSKRYYAVI